MSTSAEEFDFDLFVSHASEDKDPFVRPLVAALRDAHLQVWFDETALRVGDSLIQSIERGLARSRFGLVVLSPAFFAKRWPRAELDALTSRELATGERVVLPIWLDVNADDIRRYSPLLADRYAISGNRGLEYTTSRVTEVIRPGGSPLVLARSILADHGVATPPPTDDYWIDAIESAAELEGEGQWQSAMLWERWSFPLPSKDGTVEGRARRLAQAVMRNAWVAEAERRPITQITEPTVVHEFIAEMPGLMETCLEHPSYLGAYAPQLLIPGFEGPFEELFDEWLAFAEDRGRADETVALHKSDYSRDDPGYLAQAFVMGELNGPRVQYYETIDYLFWLLSSASEWLPDRVRDVLTAGLRETQKWAHQSREGSVEIEERLLTAIQTSDAVDETLPRTPATAEIVTDLARVSAEELALPESAEDLADRLFNLGRLDERSARRARARRRQTRQPAPRGS